MNNSVKSAIGTFLVCTVLGYFLLAHENMTAKDLSRTMTIGDARGMVTRCIENANGSLGEAEKCAMNGFIEMLNKPQE